ncbi:glycosyltransferase [Oribacterium sp. P6A1]|uniref:glycosyltransferase n=1 Tax=Oribacterium sp. P6A1 TaxID=1410612 RepID=UPI00055AB0DE|nr:glycosyltransferase [Oribacterium sp. P6A1]
MKYDIAFLSVIIPAEMENEVRSKSIRRMEDAAIAWQRHIIAGIEEINNGPVNIINVLPVEAYPMGYKDATIKKYNFAHTEGASDINVGFCNIKIIKRIVQWCPIFREVELWASKDNGMPKVLVAYTMYPEFMRAISFVKKVYPDITTIDIVVDLPQFIALAEKPLSPLGKLYQQWSEKQAKKNIHNVDGIVAITKQMAQLISKDKPYEIVEGISTPEFPELNPQNDDNIRIIYAGLLHKKFGIMKLLDAFARIEESNLNLVICGLGEAEDEIISRSKDDNRIQFLGQLPREKVLDIMSGCDVIINPRENTGEYTKYSFPSKDLEALSSGIPFIGYKLDGIPDEYDQFINYPMNDSIDALAHCIVNVGKTCNKQAREKANRAKIWIMENKSPSCQGTKIFELINRIRSSK